MNNLISGMLLPLKKSRSESEQKGEREREREKPTRRTCLTICADDVMFEHTRTEGWQRSKKRTVVQLAR